MTKRILAILMAVMLTLASFAAMADGAWTCPACGTESSGNFCPDCGTARPPQTWTCENGHDGNTGNFCTECGARRPDDATEPATSPAAASTVGSTLDSAFAAGCVAFVPAEMPLPDFMTCELVIPDLLWMYLNIDPISDVAMRLALMIGTLTPVSISPDGTHMAAWLEIGGNVVPLAISENRVAVICPTSDRGAEDTYGNRHFTYRDMYLTKKASSPMNMGQEGMIWSPGGRYFCSIDYMQVMRLYKYAYCNPIIVDTETGEMFLLDTFPYAPKDDTAGCILTGCFSRDGKYFYAIYYGREYDTLCMPLCYDLETGEKVTWGNGLDFWPYPALAELADGSLLAFCADATQSNPMFLASMAPGRRTRFSAFPASQGVWSIRYAQYSADSGWFVGRGGFLWGRVVGAIDAIQRLRPDESLEEELDTAWAISAETRKPEAVKLETVATLVSNGDEAAQESLSREYLPIADMALSPDGHYVALLVGTVVDHFLLVVRLDDMAALEAEGIPLSDQVVIQNNGMSGIWWSEAGLLVCDGDEATLWAVEE